MSLLSWLPWQTHPGASCDRRERNSAIAAIAGCFVLALGLVIAAIMFAAPADPPGDDAAGTSGDGYGTGSGSGFGAGVGSGSALAGDGPGAGTSGNLPGAVGDTADSAPRGQRTGTLASANAVEGESLVSGESKDLPKFGFTLPNVNDPIDPPQTATAVGKKDGKDGAGRAGAGGGGGAEFMGIPAPETDIVYLLDFSASMDFVAGRMTALKRQMSQSISALGIRARFTIVIFGQSVKSGAKEIVRPDNSVYPNCYVFMPPQGDWVVASEPNKSTAIDWLTRKPTDIEGCSDCALAMNAVLMLKPKAVFLLTDEGIQDIRELQEVLAKGNPDQSIQINTIAFTASDAEGGADLPDLKDIAKENKGLYRRVTITPP
jgi:hypothetical protein